MNSRELMSLSFPGGALSLPKPTREQLVESCEQWSDLVAQYADMIGRDLRNCQVPSERVIALQSAMDRLKASMGELENA